MSHQHDDTMRDEPAATVPEQMTAMLAGELSPADAEALRAQIAADTALANEFEELERTWQAFDALEAEAVNETLSRQVLDAVRAKAHGEVVSEPAHDTAPVAPTTANVEFGAPGKRGGVVIALLQYAAPLAAAAAILLLVQVTQGPTVTSDSGVEVVARDSGTTLPSMTQAGGTDTGASGSELDDAAAAGAPGAMDDVANNTEDGVVERADSDMENMRAESAGSPQDSAEARNASDDAPSADPMMQRNRDDATPGAARGGNAAGRAPAIPQPSADADDLDSGDAYANTPDAASDPAPMVDRAPRRRWSRARSARRASDRRGAQGR